MTQKEYMQRNALGFEGDGFLKAMFEKIIKDNNIDTVIETGTFYGNSTKKYAEMNGIKNVFTIEANPEYFKMYPEIFNNYPTVKYYLGDSGVKLYELLKELTNNYFLTNEGRSCLIMCDAHWNAENNPLLKELQDIANFGLKPIIAIHDFKSPNNPELGYDVYGEIIYEWAYIENHIKAIYGENGFDHFYNNEAEGAKRGCVFILPKKA